MKKITQAIIALAALAGFAGCAKEQAEAPGVPRTDKEMIFLSLTAGQDAEWNSGQDDAKTRAAIDGTDVKIINWSKDDKISVFDADSKNCVFTLKEEDAGKSTGTFDGKVGKTSATGYTALYPYQSGASCDGSKISGVVLKSAQTATAGSFDPEAALMCGKSATADGELAFKNVVGYVKFTTDFACSNITLVSNNVSDKLAGTVEITPDDTPKVSVTSGVSRISLSAASGTVAAGTYYFAVLPETLKDGARLVFTMPDGTQRYKSYSKIGEIKSNGVKNIKTTVSLTGLKEDLSASESANCYLIKAAGNYAFRAVQGNSSASVGSVTSVEVLWESFGTSTAPTRGDLISSAKLNGEYIEFSTPSTFKQGNAVIAAKDTGGTILWSWHIWCASEGWKEQVYFNSAGTMMDRNLGATSATAGEVGSLGLYYQWGRKDPFRSTDSVSGTGLAKSANSSSTSWATSSDTATQELTRKNPMTFYYKSSLPDGSWASAKTAYDPCPAGWRVPDGGANGIWAKASGKIESFEVTFGTYGIDFRETFGAGVWYPASGIRNGASAKPEYVGNTGSYYSVTTISSNVYCLYFTNANYANPNNSYGRAHGRSVRCQKIQ